MITYLKTLHNLFTNQKGLFFYFKNLGNAGITISHKTRVNSREYATFHNGYRLTGPGPMVKIKEMPIHPEYKLKIMPELDHSGFSHYLLVDRDFCDKFYVKVWGAFSSSPFNINGPKAILVDTININGEQKNQYLHPYNEPRLLRKTALHSFYAEVLEKETYCNIMETVKNVLGYK